MKMYVACLASYNAGRHHGEWFDLQDYFCCEDLEADIAVKVLETSPVPGAEEWAAHDYDGVHGFGEYPNLDELLEYVRLIAAHGDAWQAFTAYEGKGVSEEDFMSAYLGQYDSEAAFAEEWACEVHGLTGQESFFSWIDWQRAWDADLQHSFVYTEGYVFRRHF